MISFPNAKINLGLHVVERRADGYHHIETLFYPIPLYDALEFEVDKHASCDRLQVLGTQIEVSTEENLVMKAVERMRQEAEIPWLKIALLKRIPSGAGLGGGSSDAAFMLKMLNEGFALGLSEDRLEGIALELGADCPFFVRNRARMAKGLGQIFSEANIPSLSGKYLVLIKPKIHIHTGKAYQSLEQIGYRTPTLQELIESPLKHWRGRLGNDFEDVVFAWHPELQAIKDLLYQKGAIYAAMSGSGSTIYGIFSEPIELGKSDLIADSFLWQSEL